MWKNLFDEWLVAYRAKGGRVTQHEEELFYDFFGWLKAKAAEHSVQRTCAHAWEYDEMLVDENGIPLQVCKHCGASR